MTDVISDLLTFLDRSPTAYHAVHEIEKRLHKESFIELKESAAWSLHPGKKYYVVRHDSSICAFILPQSKKPAKIKLLASHTDSPGFKLKPHSQFRKGGCLLIETEVYGAPLLNSWLNRDLAIAGRIFFTDQFDKIQKQLIQSSACLSTIPQLAIHLDRDINEKGLLLNKQENLHAIAGLEADFPEPQSFLASILPNHISLQQVLGADLFFYPMEGSKLVGKNSQLLASYRLDSLASVHAALTALCNQSSPHDEDIKMILFTDHEEVGSQSTNGAASPFFQDIFKRIQSKLNLDQEEGLKIFSRSLCFSIDMAHTLHPNYIEKHDPQHHTLFGKGVIIKVNAQNRYATTGNSLAIARWIASKAAVPVQMFASKNDMPCGTTIGPILAAQTGIATVDLGCGQLSMHSCRELMACSDQLYMIKFLETALTSDWE